MYKTITREQLFESVWSRPMVQVARDLGISDVGLKKICLKMAVPTPGRGYWRRKEQGFNVPEPKLPKLPTGAVSQVSITRNASSRGERPESDPPPQGLAEALDVANKETEAHRLVQRARKSLGKAKLTEKGLVRPTAENLISISVSRDALDRALATADRILKVLEALGNRVHVDSNRVPALRVKVLDEDLGISIEEKVSARRYVPRPNDKHKSFWELPRYEYEPTGQLTVRILGDLPYGLRTSWSDGKVQRVERILDKVVTGIYAAARAQTQKRIDDERKAREREETRRRFEEAQRIRRLEAQREKHLEKLAAQYEVALRVQGFVEAVERNSERLSGIRVQGMEFLGWLTWAKHYAEQIDPLRSAALWDIEEQVPAWELRESYY